MANQIRITPDQLRETASLYRNEAESIQGVVGKLDSLVQQIQSEWEGSASDAFTAHYQDTKPLFMRAEEYIQDIASALIDVARIVEEVDASIASQFRG